MTCQRIREVWDRARDGDLPPDLQQALEDHLGQCPACRTQWEAESQWLTALAEADPDLQAAGRGGAFREAVLSRWQADRPGVVARLGPRRLLAGAAAIAAIAAALVVLLTVLHGPGAPGTGNRPDPLTLVIQDLDRRYVQKPVALFREVQQTAASIRLERLADLLELLDVPLPDPAHYIPPPADPKRGDRGV